MHSPCEPPPPAYQARATRQCVKIRANSHVASGRSWRGRWAQYNGNAGFGLQRANVTRNLGYLRAQTLLLTNEGGEGSARYHTSSGVKSLGMLKRCRISSGVLHCLMYSATVLQVRSSRSFTSRKLAACQGKGDFRCPCQHTWSRSPNSSACIAPRHLE